MSIKSYFKQVMFKPNFCNDFLFITKSSQVVTAGHEASTCTSPVPIMPEVLILSSIPIRTLPVSSPVHHLDCPARKRVYLVVDE